MKELTRADVLEVTGLTPLEFRKWCEAGAVKPAEGGGSQGSHRQFTPMQTVGIAVAAKIWKSEQGCVLSYVSKVVDAFATMDEAELLKQFDKGRTHLVVIHQGKPLLDGKKYDWVDVRQTYEHVMKQIAKIEHRFRDFCGGRPRGLAGANR